MTVKISALPFVRALATIGILNSPMTSKAVAQPTDCDSGLRVNITNATLDESFNGKFLEFRQTAPTMTISQVKPGSIADKAGLREGQKIISVESDYVSDRSSFELNDMAGQIEKLKPYVPVAVETDDFDFVILACPSVRHTKLAH